eukprot:1193125-Prorocentrum_minimum.AAC.1
MEKVRKGGENPKRGRVQWFAPIQLQYQLRSSRSSLSIAVGSRTYTPYSGRPFVSAASQQIVQSRLRSQKSIEERRAASALGGQR